MMPRPRDGLHPPRILKLNRKSPTTFDGPRYVMSILQAQDALMYVKNRCARHLVL